MPDSFLTSTAVSLPAIGAPAPPDGQRAQTKIQETAFEPKYIIYVLLKRLRLIVAVVAIVPTIAWMYARKLPLEYQASATMVLDSHVPQYLGQQFKDAVDFEQWWSTREYMETQFYIIRSRKIALQVGRELCGKMFTERLSRTRITGLHYFVPEVDCKDPASVERAAERAAPRLQRMITVAGASKDNRVAELVARGHDPELVALIANTYVKTYIASNKSRRLGASDDATRWLGTTYDDMQKAVQEAEAKMVKFKIENNLLNIDDQQNDIARKQRGITDRLEKVRLDIIALRPKRDLYARVRLDGDPVDDLPPLLHGNEVVNRLKGDYVKALQEKIDLAGRYLEEHPKVVAQEARIAALREELRREIRMAVRSAQAEYDVLVRQEQDLRRAAAEATREALALQARVIRYNQLKLDFDRLRQAAEKVGGRETESRLAARMPTNNVSELDLALVPSGPSGPNVQRAVLISLGIALALALALAFLLELLDSTVKTQEDVEQVLHMPFLGIIPHLPDEPGVDGELARKDLYIARRPKSPVAECCRVIRTNLLFMSPDRPARTLLVTSAGPQEGKSMSSVSLALSMAQSGSKVLLVDTDMRRPRLHHVFGLSSSGPGLTAAIAGTSPVMEVVRPTEQQNLFVLPCGPMPPNPAELLQTERFKKVVRDLSQGFDKVIFDSPPVGAVTDALVLSQLTDGVVLVAKSHKTSREALRRAERQLMDLSAKMLGCVLNDLDLEGRRRGYGYPYYYYNYRSGYYRYGYYGSGEDEDAEKAGEPA